MVELEVSSYEEILDQVAYANSKEKSKLGLNFIGTRPEAEKIFLALAAGGFSPQMIKGTDRHFFSLSLR